MIRTDHLPKKSPERNPWRKHAGAVTDPERPADIHDLFDIENLADLHSRQSHQVAFRGKKLASLRGYFTGHLLCLGRIQAVLWRFAGLLSSLPRNDRQTTVTYCYHM